jgi:hypothetical protein
MTITILLIAFLTRPETFGQSGVRFDPQDTAVKPKESPDFQWPPRSVEGTVIDLTKDSVTIRTADQKAQAFRIGGDLADGTIAPVPSPNALHLFSDVKLGDKVEVGYVRTDGELICREIGIHRRPGGRVPPAQDKGDLIRKPRFRFHELMNAYQDLEEKGIPIPPKFDPPNWAIPSIPGEKKASDTPIKP